MSPPFITETPLSLSSPFSSHLPVPLSFLFDYFYLIFDLLQKDTKNLGGTRHPCWSGLAPELWVPWLLAAV